jgi:hypothetical protein
VPAAAAPHSATNDYVPGADEPDLVKTNGSRVITVAGGVLRVVSDGPGHELFRPSILVNGFRALRALRAAAPALITWAQAPEETH